MSIKQEWPETITAQEVFDHVIQHLRDQNGNRAIVTGFSTAGSCVYRTPEGNACAAGALLTDAEAAAITESIAPWHKLNWDTKPVRLLPHENLIRELQNLHDIDAFERRMPLNAARLISAHKLAQIADFHGVQYTAPPTGW